MSAIEDLIHTVSRLRAPDGCPWDQEQTHKSLAQCLIDECSELLETIDLDDKEHMREELGDVLCQVVMHAQMAREDGHFDFEDVAHDINEKLVRRHPHVFAKADAQVDSSGKVLKLWDEIKAQEKGRPQPKGLFKDLPPQLPALLYADAVVKQVNKKAIPTHSLLDQGEVESAAQTIDESSVGRELFHLVARCRAAGIDPESALRRYTTELVETCETEQAQRDT
ncbi:MAG: MazG family protein [Verrucomicrobiota bacterium]